MKSEDLEIERLAKMLSPDLCRYLGHKTREYRTKGRESQQAFAQRAGIALRTFKRFEADGSGSIDTLARVLIAMERARYAYMLFPTPVIHRPTITERLNDLDSKVYSKQLKERKEIKLKKLTNMINQG